MKHVKSIGIVCVWVALWAVVAWAIGSPIILASPYETICALGASLVDPSFWVAIGGTFCHIAAGLIAACMLGCSMGAAAARWRAFEALFSPAMQFIKSAPIVCFIVLMLVWFGSTYVDFAAVFLAVLPVYYFSLSEACRQRDAKRVEMLQVFRVPFWVRLRVFEWPSVRPFFTQSTHIAVGMAWKSGVTAELVGLAFTSIGEQIYLSKLTLDTASLLMWTIVIVLLSWACEKIVLALLGRIGNHMPRSVSTLASENAVLPPRGISIVNVSKSFGGQKIIAGLTLHCSPGSRTCVMAQTGAGKTTLLNIAMGLLQQDEGSVTWTGEKATADVRSQSSGEMQRRPHISAVFQEERLLKQLTAEQNVSLIAPASKEQANLLLAELLGQEFTSMQPSELSGGMKRCVEICRALAAPSSCVLLDEPFTGLDFEKKQRAIVLINRELNGRTLLLVSHNRFDADALGCLVVRLQDVNGCHASSGDAREA